MRKTCLIALVVLTFAGMATARSLVTPTYLDFGTCGGGRQVTASALATMPSYSGSVVCDTHLTAHNIACDTWKFAYGVYDPVIYIDTAAFHIGIGIQMGKNSTTVLPYYTEDSTAIALQGYYNSVILYHVFATAETTKSRTFEMIGHSGPRVTPAAASSRILGL